jgi:hypothetical protein
MFELPPDLRFNRGPITDPAAYLESRECASWVCLTGEIFAGMPGGISFAQVQQATPNATNVVSDPPVVLDLRIAREHVRALDEAPRPVLVTCRAGPRSSAVAYMYAGLRAGAEPDDVVAAAERDDAPFVKFEDLKGWVRASIEGLRAEG